MAHVFIFSVEPSRELGLVEAIKALGEWGILTPTSYLVEGEFDPGKVMECLQPMLGPMDALWVIKAGAPWAGHGDPIVGDLAVACLGHDQAWIPRDWDEATQSRP